MKNEQQLSTAARRALTRIMGRRHQAVIVSRVSGDTGKTGVFQCYQRLRDGTQVTSVGPNIHVSADLTCAVRRAGVWEDV